MKSNNSTLAAIISRSLEASKVDVEASVEWQKKPREIVDFLKAHMQDYGPEERRFLYAKSIELADESLLSLLVDRLQHEDDAPSIMLMETILKDKMNATSSRRYLRGEIQCRNPVAEKVLRNLRLHFRVEQ